MCGVIQPSSERSHPDDEPADLAEMDTVDQLSRDNVSTTGPPAPSTDPPADQRAVSIADDPVPEHELIDPNDALKALKAFVEENNKHRVRHVRLSLPYATP